MKTKNIVIILAVIAAAAAGYYFWQANAAKFRQEENGTGRVDETQVVRYEPSEELPRQTNPGHCFSNSLAEPYREDAWRCMVGNEIHDPCFSIAKQDAVVCDINPLAGTAGFQLQLTKPLPPSQISQPVKENWGWLVELADGTICAPFTGTRPVLGGETAYYGCISADQTRESILLGDLKKDKVWTAKEGILTSDENNISLQSTRDAQVKTVWQ